jgi:PAS domain S-box-containing protein
MRDSTSYVAGFLMEKEIGAIGAFWRCVLGLAILAVLYVISVYDYLFFHIVVEGFSIVVGCAIFLIAWNSRRFLDNDYLLFLGIAYLFVAGFDFLHALAYKGMNVFPKYDANLPTQLWIIARYIQSASLLVAPLFLRRRLPIAAVFGVYVGISGALLSSLFVAPVFPDCFVEGMGLTKFKVYSEYVICLFLGGSMLALYRHRAEFDESVLRYLNWSVLALIVGELFFVHYISVYGISNLIGHYFKLISFYFLYKALVEKGLTRPYDLLFRDLNKKHEELQQERNFVSAILDTAGSLVVVLDVQGRIVRFNRACERITGYLFDEVRGKPIWDLFLIPEEREPVKAVFARLTSERLPSNYENYWVARDGSRHLISWSNTVLFGETGQVAHVIATGIDVTEKRRAEQEILRAKEEWETTFDAVPDLIMILDSRHQVLRANRAMTEALRVAPQDLIGKPCFGFVHGTDSPPPSCVHTQLMSDGQEHHSEVYDNRMNAVLSVTCSPLRDRNGRLMGSVHVARDITERKRSEEALKRTLAELERSNSELQQFAYVASHDLQEPLRMISSYMRLLERRYKGKLDADADDFIAYAVDGAKRMSRLINDLLQYSRVGAHGKAFQLVDCETLLSQALANLQVSVDEIRGRVTKDPLPSVIGDGVQLAQLFQNLIDNALKFHGNDPPVVHVSAQRDHDHWLFSVSDNGIGIPAEYAERIFMIFQRLHGRDEYPGTGIGLAICKKIVERHGGHIWVAPRQDKGTTFLFTIPCERG